MEYKILLVEDEKDIREVVKKYLEKEGYLVYAGENGVEGLEMFNNFNPDLAVLDIMMPGIDGIQVMKEIRKVSNIPVLFLTAKHKEEDRLKGFDLGADDYVVKPFSPKELVRRINAIIKRVYSNEKISNYIVYKDLKLDLDKQTLYKNNENLEITSKEFEILKAFFSNIGIILKREQIIEKAFGYDYEGFDRTIDTHIKKIRQKIEKDSKNPEYIKTKYGAGYIFGGDE
ncbi:MAG: response regulator transcription factor [Bacillota bacterium]|nr:response regulator transcription factor [Bacillota bacterium]